MKGHEGDEAACRCCLAADAGSAAAECPLWQASECKGGTAVGRVDGKRSGRA